MNRLSDPRGCLCFFPFSKLKKPRIYEFYEQIYRYKAGLVRFSAYSGNLQSVPRGSDNPDPLKPELEPHQGPYKGENDNLRLKRPASFLGTYSKHRRRASHRERGSEVSVSPSCEPEIPDWFLERNVFLYGSTKSEKKETELNSNFSTPDLYDINVLNDTFSVSKNLLLELISHLNTSFILNPEKKSENNSSRKANLMLTCPIKGSVYFLDAIVDEISNLLEADLIKISPQDLEDLVGDIFEEGRLASV